MTRHQKHPCGAGVRLAKQLFVQSQEAAPTASVVDWLVVDLCPKASRAFSATKQGKTEKKTHTQNAYESKSPVVPKNRRERHGKDFLI